jgi:hypothetical protein
MRYFVPKRNIWMGIYRLYIYRNSNLKTDLLFVINTKIRLAHS